MYCFGVHVDGRDNVLIVDDLRTQTVGPKKRKATCHITSVLRVRLADKRCLCRLARCTVYCVLQPIICVLRHELLAALGDNDSSRLALLAFELAIRSAREAQQYGTAFDFIIWRCGPRGCLNCSSSVSVIVHWAWIMGPSLQWSLHCGQVSMARTWEAVSVMDNTQGVTQGAHVKTDFASPLLYTGDGCEEVVHSSARRRCTVSRAEPSGQPNFERTRWQQRGRVRRRYACRVINRLGETDRPQT